MAKKELSQSEKIKRFLDNLYWPETLSANEVYSTEDDDSEPGKTKMMVQISNDGDAWVNILSNPSFKHIRKRTYSGGGRDKFTRLALIVLAEAMRIDAENNRMFNDTSVSNNS